MTIKRLSRGDSIRNGDYTYTFWDEWVVGDKKVEIFKVEISDSEYITAFDVKSKKPVHQKDVTNIAGNFIDKVCGFHDELRALMMRR